MNKTSIAIINAHGSFDTTCGREALDIALIYGSYEQEVSLFFQGEGVRQLSNNQQPEKISAKDYLATFPALEFYDVENIYVCLESLKERNLFINFHIDNVQCLSAANFSNKLRQHKIILRF